MSENGVAQLSRREREMMDVVYRRGESVSGAAAQLGVPFSILDANGLRGSDLRRYNVLVLPPGGLSGWLGDHGESIAEWVRAGGTLIASGSAKARPPSRYPSQSPLVP